MYMNFFSMLISIEIWMLLLLIALMFDKNVFVRMLFQILLHWKYWLWWLSVHFSSVAQLCPTLCHSMNCSTPGLPVHHQLLEFTQTHVHRVSDTIQPSHPLSSPSPPAPQSLQASESFPMSQLFAWGGQSTGVWTWTSGSSRFTYCWSLAWRILSITLLACEMREALFTNFFTWACWCF